MEKKCEERVEKARLEEKEKYEKKILLYKKARDKRTQNEAKYYSPKKVMCITEKTNEYLGKGRYGFLKLANIDEIGTVAVKCFNFKIVGTPDRIKSIQEKIKNEIRQMYKANHNNVVRIYGSTSWPGYTGIIMEYMQAGDLHTVLFDFKINIAPIIRLRFCCDITLGMTYLHNGFNDQRMTHGDLKPQNILLTSDLTCKISDFEGANLATCSDFVSQERTTEKIVYTREYLAPERLKDLLASGSIPLTTKAMDVYSVGMIFQGILIRKPPPTMSKRKQEEDRAVRNIKKTYSNQDDRKIIDAIQSKMNESRVENPEGRPKMMEIQKHFSQLFSEVNMPVHQLQKHVSDITQHMNIRRTMPPQAFSTPIDNADLP